MGDLDAGGIGMELTERIQREAHVDAFLSLTTSDKQTFS